MPTDPHAAWIAVHRFGLGPRPGELDAASRDPQGWLLAQIDDPPRSTPFDALPDHMDLQREALAAMEQQGEAGRKAVRRYQKRVHKREVAARVEYAAVTPAPFHERLTWFWSDHFTVSVTNKRVAHLVGAFEREAIRPNVGGRFEQLLLATTQHPAMLLYLDNAGSIGPDTMKAQRRGKGLNENLAREIVELHTLGVHGGYSQDDVIALAELITGWTVFGGPPKKRADLSGRHGFTFRADLHQPGSKTLLGRRYGQGGVEEGEAALRALSRTPATARFVADKLARHFLGVDASSDVIDALAGTFQETRGDLAKVARTLVTHPHSWRKPEPGSSALRDPARLLAASSRALDLGGWRGKKKPWSEKVAEAQAWLGQPTWRAPSPAGWSVDPADWAGPEQVLRRVELAWRIGQAVGDRVAQPESWASEVLGVQLSTAVRNAVARAPSRADAVATVLASPAFQWT